MICHVFSQCDACTIMDLCGVSSRRFELLPTSSTWRMWPFQRWLTLQVSQRRPFHWPRFHACCCERKIATPKKETNIICHYLSKILYIYITCLSFLRVAMGHYKENMRTRFTWISRLFCAFMVVWMCPMVAWIWFDRQLWERCQLGLRGILSNIRLWDLNIDRDVASVVWEIAWRCYTATGSRESFHRKQHKSFQPSFCTFHRCLWAGKLGWKGVEGKVTRSKAAHHDWRDAFLHQELHNPNHTI